MLSISSTTRRGESMASALAINFRLSAARPGEVFFFLQHFRLERLQARSYAAPRSQVSSRS